MAFSQVNGIKLHTQSIGEGEPLVLLHGLMLGSIATWYFTTGPLLGEAYRVLMYDLRGHGKSERVPTGYDINTMVDDLAALLEVEGIERLSLAGHSYGGLIALYFSLKFPERVTRLALVDIPLLSDLAKGFEESKKPDLKELFELLSKPLKDAFRGGGRQARNLSKSLLFLHTKSSLADDLCKVSDLSDGELAGITCPTLLLFGDASPYLPVGQRLAEVLPGAELKEISAGHHIPMENPEAMNQTLTHFFGVN